MDRSNVFRFCLGVFFLLSSSIGLAQNNRAEVAETTAYNNLLDILEVTYPVINPKSATFDRTKAAEVEAAEKALERVGHPPIEALGLAVASVLGLYRSASVTSGQSRQPEPINLGGFRLGISKKQLLDEHLVSFCSEQASGERCYQAKTSIDGLEVTVDFFVKNDQVASINGALAPDVSENLATYFGKMWGSPDTSEANVRKWRQGKTELWLFVSPDLKTRLHLTTAH